MPGFKEPLEITDEELKDMGSMFYGTSTQARETWNNLLKKWRSRAESLKKVVVEISGQESGSTAPALPQPLPVPQSQSQPTPATQQGSVNTQQQVVPQPTPPPAPQPAITQQGKGEEWGPLKPVVMRREVREPVDKEDWSVLQPVGAKDCGNDCPPLDIYDAIPDLRIMQFQGIFTQQEAESISKKLAKTLLKKGVSAVKKLLEEIYMSKANGNKQTT
jgi:hypothetical protein